MCVRGGGRVYLGRRERDDERTSQSLIMTAVSAAIRLRQTEGMGGGRLWNDDPFWATMVAGIPGGGGADREASALIALSPLRPSVSLLPSTLLTPSFSVQLVPTQSVSLVPYSSSALLFLSTPSSRAYVSLSLRFTNVFRTCGFSSTHFVSRQPVIIIAAGAPFMPSPPPPTSECVYVYTEQYGFRCRFLTTRVVYDRIVHGIIICSYGPIKTVIAKVFRLPRRGRCVSRLVVSTTVCNYYVIGSG